MKTRYDAETDALWLRFAESPIIDSEEVRPGVVLDVDAAGRIIAIEVLEVSDQLARGAELAHPVAA